MVALARPDLIEKLPGWGAAASAAAVAAGAMAMPGGWFEALLPVAAPSGETARAVLALGGGAVAAPVAWAALYLLLGCGRWAAGHTPVVEGAPSVRRADAHPDAPPRRPLSLAELQPAPIGRAVTPTPVIPVPMAGPLERDLPANLDTPLSALDPAAIPPTPRRPARALAPLAPGERLRTFALAPPAPVAPASSQPGSIEALLRRLERGAERRVGAR